MDVTARPARVSDVPEVVRMFRLLEAEMAALESVWPDADGLAEPIEGTIAATLTDSASTLLVGCIDEVPFGFLLARRHSLLPQGDRAPIGSIRLIFTEPDAREVGVGAAMLGKYLAAEREAGVFLFDAHVTPGHRLTKNFFEAAGFSARRIVMHRDDREDP